MLDTTENRTKIERNCTITRTGLFSFIFVNSRSIFVLFSFYFRSIAVPLSVASCIFVQFSFNFRSLFVQFWFGFRPFSFLRPIGFACRHLWRQHTVTILAQASPAGSCIPCGFGVCFYVILVLRVLPEGGTFAWRARCLATLRRRHLLL